MLEDTAEEKITLARAQKELHVEADKVMDLMDDLHKTVSLWSKAIGQENISKIIINQKGKDKKWDYSKA